jgi:Mg-chelatase subunit ChlD
VDRSGRQRPELRRPQDSRQQPDRLPSSGQTPGNERTRPNDQPPPSADDEPIRLDATLVNISLLVSDRSGRYIPQLSQRDFTLYEDGVQQEIAFFGNEEVPFNVVLLLDMSPSVAGYIDEIHRAAIEFVRQLRQNDRIMVVSFDRTVNFLTDFTSNRRVLENAILSSSTGGGTSVYDAVYLAVQDRLRNIEGRKALILFSDGEDTTSRQADYQEAIDSVTESDVLVYGLRYPSDGGGNIRINPWPRNPIPQIPFPFPWPWPRRRRGPFTGTNILDQSLIINRATAAQSRSGRGRRGDFMEDVATAGGGPVYDADQVSDIGRLASRIAEELRHVYVVSYYPTNSLINGGYRSIRVRVKGRDDIAVRHRRGYNAQDMAAQPRT